MVQSTEMRDGADRPEITEALRRGDVEKLQELAKRRGEGFWRVLESLLTDPTEAWISTNDAAVVGESLWKLDLHTGEKFAFANTVIGRFARNVALAADWKGLNGQIGRGAAALMRLARDKRVSAKVTTTLLVDIGDGKADVSAEEWVEGVIELWNAVDELHHGDVLEDGIPVNYAPGSVVAICAKLHEHPEYRDVWRRITSSAAGTAIAGELPSADASSITPEKVAAISVLVETEIDIDWSAVATTLRDVLDTGSELTDVQVSGAMQGLTTIQRKSRDARKHVEWLTTNGRLAHHLHKRKTAGEFLVAAMLVREMLRFGELATPPGVHGHSNEGFTSFTSILGKPKASGEIIKELADLIAEDGDQDVLARLLEAPEGTEGVLAHLVAAFRSSDVLQDVLTPELVGSQWRVLKKMLGGKEFSEVLALVNEKSRLSMQMIESERVTGQSAELYSDLIGAGALEDSEFAKRLGVCLGEVEAEEWAKDMEASGSLLDLAEAYSAVTEAFSLSTPLERGLEIHGKKILAGQCKAGQVNGARALKLLPAHQKEVLATNLVDSAVKKGENLVGGFFTAFGELLVEPVAARKNLAVVRCVFSPIVEGTDTGAATWLAELLEKNTGVLTGYPSGDVVAFGDSVKAGIRSARGDARLGVLKRIADTIGLEVAGLIDDEDETQEEASA